MDRSNLSVLVTANVNRIVFDETSTNDVFACGVEFEYEDTIYIAKTKKEVIVSAGYVSLQCSLGFFNIPFRSLKTPHILELSGIGKKDVLEKLNVPIKVDLPGVGENFQEHMAICMSYGRRSYSTQFSIRFLIVIRAPRRFP